MEQGSHVYNSHLLGLHPLHDPLGYGHHTDIPFVEEDKQIGDALAYFLGSLFADVEGEDSRYWYYERTSVNEWSRVVRALRVHGLAIVDVKVLESQTPEIREEGAEGETP